MPLALPSSPAPSPAPRPPVDPAAAVLGALVTGALTLADVAEIDPDAFALDTHRALFPRLLAAPRPRRGHPSIEACAQACGVVTLCRPGGRFVLGPGFWRLYLVGLARGAPRRRDALAAVELLRREHERREDVARDREALSATLGEIVEDVARAWLRQVTEDGGITYRGADVRRIEGGSEEWEPRFPVRPIEPGAIPRTGREIGRLLGEAVAAIAGRG